VGTSVRRRRVARRQEHHRVRHKAGRDRYYPVIIDREAGGHYEIKNPVTGGILSYKNPEAAEKYLLRAREKHV
jgi:uncharacterized protein with von Willebrand factor type A (vWA) domain